MRLGSLAGFGDLAGLAGAIVPAAAIGALYVREAAPSVGGGNSGEFQVMAHVLGIAHPPSYPVYLLLAKLFSLLPLEYTGTEGDVAWRINLLTALLGAACLALAGLLPPALGLRGTRAAFAGAVAATALGAMPRLWTLAVEAEVFTLHLALTLAFWLALLEWGRRSTGHPSEARDRSEGSVAPVTNRPLYAAAFLAGLGLANHRTFLFIAAGGALFVLLSRARTFRVQSLLAAGALFLAGVSPYLYVLRGLVSPVAYFSPTDVHRLSRDEAWYVLQGNAAGETGGGEVLLRLFADPHLLAQRTSWLLGHLVAQFGPFAAPAAILASAGAVGLALLVRRGQRAALFVATSLLGGLGAALFAMSYAKYPDADRYLLPLEALLALGVGVLASSLLSRLSAALSTATAAARLLGAAAGATLALYFGFPLGLLSAQTDFTRGGYVHHTIFNLDGVERYTGTNTGTEEGAIVCTWWATAWGLWYAQLVDGVRPDVTVVPKGPDDCVRDVLPDTFGRRPVYFPALTDRMRQSEFVFFPSRDFWLGGARRAPLTSGALLKGPDERVFLYDGARRHWIPTLDVFAARGLTWDAVVSVPDYVLRDIPEAEPLTPAGP